MPQLEKMPGFGQAAVNALRNFVGMGPQQSAGPATDVSGSYRRYVEEAQMAGETPLSLRDWQNSQGQQLPVSTPR